MGKVLRHGRIFQSGLVIAFAAALFVSCKKDRGLYVAVAANFSSTAEDLKGEYEKKNPGVKISIITGSSGKLAMQIIHGAPYDLFLSADMGYPEKLFERGLTAAKPVPYARGRLILVGPVKAGEKQGFNTPLLLRQERIIIANPDLAPYGRAAMDMFRSKGLIKKIRGKLVLAENVVQAARYAVLGKEFTLTAKSVLSTPLFRENDKGIWWIELEEKLHRRIMQGMVIISASRRYASARGFYDFILNSREAREIIEERGYGPAAGADDREKGKS